MVPNGPFYLSQANTEFGGNGYASNILTKAGVQTPALLSQLKGKSQTLQFNLVIGEYYTGYGTQVGLTEKNGSVSPNVFDGRTITLLVSYDDRPNEIYISINGSQRAMTLSISGQGQVTFTSSGGSQKIQWNGIYQWLYARRGQTVSCTLQYA